MRKRMVSLFLSSLLCELKLFQSVAALKAEIAQLKDENSRLRHVLNDVNGRIVSGRLTGEMPDNFLKQFKYLPDCPLEQVLRFLPANQVVQMRYVSRRFNQVMRRSHS